MQNLFDKISDKQKEKILKSLEAHTFEYQENAHITSFVKGDNFIAYIESGYIQIYKMDKNGTKVILEELEEGETFGTHFSTFLQNDFEIIAKENTAITYIDNHRIFQSDLSTKPYYFIFMQNLFTILSEKEQEKNERILILTKKTIRNKLLEYFKIMSRKNNSKYIYLPYNFTDLADYLSVDRSAMMREIKLLVEDGIIEKEKNKITLIIT